MGYIERFLEGSEAKKLSALERTVLTKEVAGQVKVTSRMQGMIDDGLKRRKRFGYARR